MSEHIHEWLGAYHDGELRGARMQQVEKHLAACTTCRAELEDLRALSALLHEPFPEADFLPTDRFVTQVMLEMPRTEIRPKTRKVTEFSWWLVPVALMLILLFFNITQSLSAYASIAANFGLLGSSYPFGTSTQLQMSWFSSAMNLFGGQLGGLGQAILGLLNNANVFIAQLVKPLIPQAIVTAAYLGWLMAWWLNQQENPATPVRKSSAS